MKSYEVIGSICKRLWDADDPDCHAAEEYMFKDQIIDLFENCYDYEDFCNWLADHDCNPAFGFRQAEIYSRNDFETEEEFLDAREDCLFYNDDYICKRW